MLAGVDMITGAGYRLGNMRITGERLGSQAGIHRKYKAGMTDNTVKMLGPMRHTLVGCRLDGHWGSLKITKIILGGTGKYLRGHMET